jgi:hypothetical protein
MPARAIGTTRHAWGCNGAWIFWNPVPLCGVCYAPLIFRNDLSTMSQETQVFYQWRSHCQTRIL